MMMSQKRRISNPLDSSEFSVASGSSTSRELKVASLKKNLNDRRASLTPIEFSYVRSLVENDAEELCEEKLSILEENLANIEVSLEDGYISFQDYGDYDQEIDDSFNNTRAGIDDSFTGGTSIRRKRSSNGRTSSSISTLTTSGGYNNSNTSSSISAASAVASVGSARRSEKLERRRSSGSMLWKKAGMNVMALNRLMKATAGVDDSGRSSVIMSVGDSYRGSISANIRAIREDAALLSGYENDDDNEDEEEDDNDKDEKKAAEEDGNYPPITSTNLMARERHDLMTRRASQNAYAGEGFEIGEESMFQLYAKHFDPWEVTTDADGNPFEFHIIGTTGDDVDAQPHVLSPPQMHSLQEHLPYSKRGESFWLKYSLVRDGASKAAFLQHLRAEDYTVMAMETLDGEIFGAFATKPWTIQHGYFGTSECFVWKLKHPREEDDINHNSTNINLNLTYEERERREREIEVFKYSFDNNTAQICTHARIAVGGGTVSEPRMVADGTVVEPNQFGFAISFDGNSMLEASSSPCTTFNSPGLCMHHQDGSKFELLNLEVWAMTPAITLKDAHRMACHKLFLKRNMTV